MNPSTALYVTNAALTGATIYVTGTYTSAA